MKVEENGNGIKFLLKAWLVYLLLIMGVASVTILTFFGKVNADTFEKILLALFAYVAGWVSPRAVQ